MIEILLFVVVGAFVVGLAIGTVWALVAAVGRLLWSARRVLFVLVVVGLAAQWAGITF